MKLVKIINTKNPETIYHLIYCDTFFRKLKGLMFVKEINQNEGIILVEQTESRIDTSIHMLFMNFDITALWLNKNFEVVHKIMAKKWRLGYFSPQKAQYVVELNQASFKHFSIGDLIQIKYEK